MHWMFHRTIFAQFGAFMFLEKADIGKMRVGQNIGHSIIAQAVFTGLEAAVRDMKTCMAAARR